MSATVASLRVFVAVGVFYILFGIIGKIGAFFITMPYSVLGGVTMISFGMFIGFNFANLQPVELNSRNLSIIGTSMLLGISFPLWISTTPDAVNTGIFDLDRILKAFIGNPTFTGGLLACLLDNTVPGTYQERGLTEWLNLTTENVTDDETSDGIDYYGLPFLRDLFMKSRLLGRFPFLPGYQSKTL